jgi:hypothetical protein
LTEEEKKKGSGLNVLKDLNFREGGKTQLLINNIEKEEIQMII